MPDDLDFATPEEIAVALIRLQSQTERNLAKLAALREELVAADTECDRLSNWLLAIYEVSEGDTFLVTCDGRDFAIQFTQAGAVAYEPLLLISDCKMAPCPARHP